jgi:hypothetical protein
MRNRALQIGAEQYSLASSNHGWQPMETAPRDGTVIEVRNTYGVAPTYSLAKWGMGFGGERWQKATDPSSGWISESSLWWRPYAGDVSAYVDPTGGAQNDMAYWRGAVARKYGLPLDHFEALAAANERRNHGFAGVDVKTPWWTRLFRALAR